MVNEPQLVAMKHGKILITTTDYLVLQLHLKLTSYMDKVS